MEATMKKAAVIMGSDSDLPVVEKCINELKAYGIPTEVHVYSAHRTPDEAIAFAKGAEEAGFGVIISAAGKAAHLGGVIAANTVLPVIGIPIKASAMEGLDALLSTVQMPPGIPVASVAIDGAKNAAIFAAEILAVSDEEVRAKLKEARAKAHDDVIAKDEKVSAEYSG
jgi:5-(carboxyamino)imidazole ribonucleotide mutase